MIIRADAHAIPLADGCVDCVVTSPPYWGLRDYGTATWEGGDPACGHIERKARGDSGRLSTDTRRGINPAPVDTPMYFRDSCRTCGAVRRDAQLGLEPTPDAYVAALVAVFRDVARVLKPGGTVWINLGDSYNSGAQFNQHVSGLDSPARYREGVTGGVWPGHRPLLPDLKPKDLVGIPWRVAFALQADGWWLRSDIIWAKPNPMPESVTDRPTRSHEYLFLLTRSERYFYDAEAIAEAATCDRVRGPALHPSSDTNGNSGLARRQSEGIRNKRSVWTIPTMPYAGAHFATMPEALVEPCILAGCPLGGLVLDPFLGSGTVGAVAERLGRRWVGTDLSYQPLAKTRTAQRGIPWEVA